MTEKKISTKERLTQLENIVKENRELIIKIVNTVNNQAKVINDLVKVNRDSLVALSESSKENQETSNSSND